MDSEYFYSYILSWASEARNILFLRDSERKCRLWCDHDSGRKLWSVLTKFRSKGFRREIREEFVFEQIRFKCLKIVAFHFNYLKNVTVCIERLFIF